MFNEQTTFILGAGASCPYGYPSGADLIKKILTLDATFLHHFFTQSDTLIDRWARFNDDLRYSHTKSIDAFLESRSDYSDIGKVAIGQVLVNCERTNPLRVEPANWYSLLVQRLGSSFDLVPQNQLRILTFNYDRSLEHFLHQSLQSRYGPNADVATALRQFKIIHMYGSLGRLPWQLGEGNARAYGETSPMYVKMAADNIRLIHEARRDDALQQQIDRVLRASTHIYILGFGFHEDNMELLRDGLKGKNPRATFLGLTNAEAIEVRERCQFGPLQHSKNNAYDFLREDDVFAKF